MIVCISSCKLSVTCSLYIRMRYVLQKGMKCSFRGMKSSGSVFTVDAFAIFVETGECCDLAYNLDIT